MWIIQNKNVVQYFMIFIIEKVLISIETILNEVIKLNHVCFSFLYDFSGIQHKLKSEQSTSDIHKFV